MVHADLQEQLAGCPGLIEQNSATTLSPLRHYSLSAHFESERVVCGAEVEAFLNPAPLAVVRTAGDPAPTVAQEALAVQKERDEL